MWKCDERVVLRAFEVDQKIENREEENKTKANDEILQDILPFLNDIKLRGLEVQEMYGVKRETMRAPEVPNGKQYESTLRRLLEVFQNLLCELVLTALSRYTMCDLAQAIFDIDPVPDDDDDRLETTWSYLFQRITLRYNSTLAHVFTLGSGAYPWIECYLFNVRYQDLS